MIETCIADSALATLLEGNRRFMNNMKINRDYLSEVEATKSGQTPFAVIISCMDSRTSVELIFDQGIGDIFSIRIAGNVVTPEVIASCEYACHIVGSSLILVLGHSGCGAIRGAFDNVELGHLHTILDRIKDNVNLDGHQASDTELKSITEENVRAGVEALKTESEVLKNLLKDRKIAIRGGIYDVSNGQVSLLPGL